MEGRQFLNIAQSLLPFATDTSLDLIGEIFGVPRLNQQTASVDISEQNFSWYVRHGSFGSINSGKDIVIPSGVRIYTAAQSGPVYVAGAIHVAGRCQLAVLHRYQSLFGRRGQRPFRHLRAAQLHQLHREPVWFALDCGRPGRRRGCTEGVVNAEYSNTIRACATANRSGGQIYDALHLTAARKASCEQVYTFNPRHFRELDPDFSDNIRTP